MPFDLTIRGLPYRVRLVSRLPPDRRGDCEDPALSPLRLKIRHIRVARGLSEEDLLGTIIHETLHALAPDHTEEWVLEAERVLTEVVSAAGFRLDESLGKEERPIR